jgi:flagellar biosynthesis/type III secretory pathway M-ring protein FliF/YscJ
MDFLKHLFTSTKSHLSGLGLSQKAAIALCVVVIVGALAWLMQWSAQPQLVPLVSQDLTPDELGRIQSRMADSGATFEVRDNRVFVLPDERSLWLARLGEQQVLPSDLTITFESLMKDSSPFINMDEQAWRRQVALSSELSKILRRFSGVADARVIVDKTERRGFGGPPTVPTASVSVKMRGNAELDRAKVHAMASLVASSVAGLDLKNVTVVDATTGKAYSVPDPDSAGAFDDLDDRRRKEQYFRESLLTYFAYIPGVHIGVHAELDPDAKRMERTVYGKPVPTKSESETMTQQRGAAGAPPGVVTNTSRAIQTSGTAEKLDKSVESEEYLAGVDKTVEVSERMRHGLKSLYAAISIPRSYLVSIYKKNNPDKEPTNTDLEPIIQETLAMVKKQAMNLIAATDAAQVQVDWFHDTEPPDMAVADVRKSDELMAYVKTYGGQAGIAALAVVSLLMMLMMVRRASEGPVLPGEEPPKPIFFARGQRRGGSSRGDESESEEIWAASAPVGEARTTTAMLEGREVSAEEVRAQQVIEQVSEIIADDPNTAAGLLRNWIESED